MAYSRWGPSKLYVFWNCGGDCKDNEMLAIWYTGDERLPCFTYKQLLEISSVGGLKELIGLELSDEEYSECLECVRMFLEDVDTYYEWTSNEPFDLCCYDYKLRAVE